MKKLIKKAVIPAAGLGTRFLPATKAVPKELLPIVDVPTIQYIVEEVAEAGIESVILISGRGKSSIEDHFDEHPDLREKLLKEGKEKLVKELDRASKLTTVVSLRQGQPLGLGHAVLVAKPVINDEPFAVLLGDDLVDHTPCCTSQMIAVYEKYKKSVVAVMEVSKEEISRFGIISGTPLKDDRVLDVEKMVEKPSLEEAPSNLAIVGRYILTPRIFDILEKLPPGKGGEIQLTDALNILSKEEGVVAYKFKGKRYDAGDKLGFLQANIAFALKRKDLKDSLKKFLKDILKDTE